MKIHSRYAMTGLILAAAFAAATTTAGAAEYTIKWGLTTRGDMQHKYGEKLNEVLQKVTNGRVEVKTFPGGQLGSPAAILEGVQLGTIEGYAIPADFYVGADPRFGEFSIPFLFRDAPHANKTLADPELNAYILSMAESKGLVGVGIRVAAESLYFGAKKPLKTLADFKGAKLRVNATPAERGRMAALGATAVPMGLQEMITSLQSGVIDGTMSGISIYTNFNLQNVGKTLLETDDTLLVAFVCLSKKWLETLPPDLAKTIVDEARKLQPWAAEEAVAEGIELRAKWKERGGELIRLAPNEQAELTKLLKPIGVEVTKDNPVLKDFYERIQKTAAKY